MGMSIYDSERYLRLMLGGMKYAVRYWEDRDKEESDIEQTNVEAVKTALDTMRKYQKIRERIKAEMSFDNPNMDVENLPGLTRALEIFKEIEDGND